MEGRAPEGGAQRSPRAPSRASSRGTCAKVCKQNLMFPKVRIAMTDAVEQQAAFSRECALIAAKAADPLPLPPGQTARNIQAASQKAPASTRNARGRPAAGVSSHLRKSSSAIRAPCKRQAVERHPRDGLSPSSRATGRKPPAPVAAPGGTAPTRNRDAATVSPRFAREHFRETVGVGAGVRREHFRETAAVGAGTRKDPSAVAEGSLFSECAPRAPCLSARCRAGPIARRTPSEL